ncbi:hypothetical protein ACFL6A_01060 [bacterium]
MRTILNYLYLIICTGFMMGTDCQESLPPYTTPAGMYDIRLAADQGDLDRVQRDIGQIYQGKGGFGFHLDITNTFDETMTGSVKDTLTELQVWWKADVNVMKTFHLTPSDEIVTGELWDPVVVYFDPGDSIRLAVVWLNWLDDQNTFVWEYQSSWETEDLILYNPMTFIAEARIQLFDATPIKYSNQVEFTVTFYSVK